MNTDRSRLVLIEPYYSLHALRRAAASSGVMSRWDMPSVSKPTMKLRPVAERSSGGITETCDCLDAMRLLLSAWKSRISVFKDLVAAQRLSDRAWILRIPEQRPVSKLKI